MGVTFDSGSSGAVGTKKGVCFGRRVCCDARASLAVADRNRRGRYQERCSLMPTHTYSELVGMAVRRQLRPRGHRQLAILPSVVRGGTWAAAEDAAIVGQFWTDAVARSVSRSYWFESAFSDTTGNIPRIFLKVRVIGQDDPVATSRERSSHRDCRGGGAAAANIGYLRIRRADQTRAGSKVGDRFRRNALSMGGASVVFGGLIAGPGLRCDDGRSPGEGPIVVHHVKTRRRDVVLADPGGRDVNGLNEGSAARAANRRTFRPVREEITRSGGRDQGGSTASRWKGSVDGREPGGASRALRGLGKPLRIARGHGFGFVRIRGRSLAGRCSVLRDRGTSRPRFRSRFTAHERSSQGTSRWLVGQHVDFQ